MLWLTQWLLKASEIIENVLVLLDAYFLMYAVARYNQSDNYTPATKLVRKSCPLCYVFSSGSIISIFATNNNYH